MFNLTYIWIPFGIYDHIIVRLKHFENLLHLLSWLHSFIVIRCCRDCNQNSMCTTGQGNDAGMCVGNKDELLVLREYYMPSPPIDCDDSECECVLRCTGTLCETAGGMCILKREMCPEGMNPFNQCGCDSNKCRCCLPGKGIWPGHIIIKCVLAWNLPLMGTTCQIGKQWCLSCCDRTNHTISF